jgi:hypothetical protein
MLHSRACLSLSGFDARPVLFTGHAGGAILQMMRLHRPGRCGGIKRVLNFNYYFLFPQAKVVYKWSFFRAMG